MAGVLIFSGFEQPKGVWRLPRLSDSQHISRSLEFGKGAIRKCAITHGHRVHALGEQKRQIRQNETQKAKARKVESGSSRET